MPLPKNQFPECEGCINAEFDPIQCQTCSKGSNYEGEEPSDDDSGDVGYDEIQILIGDMQ